MAPGTKKRRNKPPSHGPKLRPVPDLAYEGLPAELPTKQLPLYKDVGLAIEMFKATNPTCNPTKLVTDNIIQVYEKASIPTLAYATVYNKVKNLEAMKNVRMKQLVFDKRRGAVITQGKFRKKSKNGKVKVQLQDVLNKLFPVADENNIPDIEREFFEEQKTSRLMVIGGVDVVETERILEEIALTEEELKEAAEQEERKVARQKAEEKLRLREKERKEREYAVAHHSEVEDDEDEPKQKKKRLSKKELSAIKPIIETAERFGLSDSAVAHIVNATNVKASIISEENSSEILYRSKIKRIRKKLRSEKVEESKGKEPIAVGFDERKDQSKVEVGKGIKGSKRFEVKKVENCAVIYWPGEEFVGHVVPRDGTGAGLAQDIVQFFKNRETNLNSLRAILTDGCAKMTGWKNGACAMIEEELVTPLQRIVCFLHHLELPFGKIFEFYDGPTTGPESFSGPIGKLIMTDIWKLPTVKFVQVENPTLLADIQSLPKDVFKTFVKKAN